MNGLLGAWQMLRLMDSWIRVVVGRVTKGVKS